MVDTRACNQISQVTLGERLTLEEFVAVARNHAQVHFSPAYCERVRRSRAVVEQWIAEERVVYGTTTGFGQLCSQTISQDETEKLQEYLILSDCCSVGEPLPEEQVRAIMLMVLQNVGQGWAGCRLQGLEYYRDFLNKGRTPFVPGEGSVGYLSVEANIAYVLLGGGKAYWQGELLEGGEALRRAGMAPIRLGAKEGLSLISGTTSPTGLAALALYDMLQAVKCADIIGSRTLEALKGLISAFDPRVMEVRPHRRQGETAENVRRILQDSQVIEEARGSHLQDALSLRCIPQLHGAAKNILSLARETVEIEMNSCCDNPIVWTDGRQSQALSACNPDSSYVGMVMDSSAIAAVGVAKMSERRNNRLIDHNLSGYPWFLTPNPGLNCGLMIPQYSQAGLLNDMRILAYPATVDCTPTCGNQEDYVAMGYNACKKAAEVSEKLEYILAMELLSDYQAQGFMGTDAARSGVSHCIYQELARHIPPLDQDAYLNPHIEYLRELIHSGKLVQLAEARIGALK